MGVRMHLAPKTVLLLLQLSLPGRESFFQLPPLLKMRHFQLTHTHTHRFIRQVRETGVYCGGCGDVAEGIKDDIIDDEDSGKWVDKRTVLKARVCCCFEGSNRRGVATACGRA